LPVGICAYKILTDTADIQSDKRRKNMNEEQLLKNQRITNKELTPKNDLTFQIKRSSPATAPKTCSLPASASDRTSSIKR